MGGSTRKLICCSHPMMSLRERDFSTGATSLEYPKSMLEVVLGFVHKTWLTSISFTIRIAALHLALIAHLSCGRPQYNTSKIERIRININSIQLSPNKLSTELAAQDVANACAA